MIDNISDQTIEGLIRCVSLEQRVNYLGKASQIWSTKKLKSTNTASIVYKRLIFLEVYS